MASWPSGLKILTDNYRETLPNRVVRSDMSIGPAKLRRQANLAVRKVSFKLFLTPAEYATFDAFYLANDSASFDFTNPRTSVVERARFVDVSEVALNETMWVVNVTLELLP